MYRALPTVIVIATLLTSVAGFARDKDEIPPANAKRLSEIVKSIEAEGHTVITDIDFDDWIWIVRVYKSGFEYEIRVDPVSGKTLSVHPAS